MATPNPHLVAAIGTGKALEIMLEYPSVFDGRIKTMEGEKFRITLTDDAKPFCIHTPWVIPFAFRDELRAELELLQNQGVIAPVTEPTEWCAPIVVTPKKGTDKIRMCVDLSQLDKYVKREVPIHHPSPGHCRHCFRKRKDLHQSRRNEGLPPMSLGRGKPITDHIHHTLR